MVIVSRQCVIHVDEGVEGGGSLQAAANDEGSNIKTNRRPRSLIVITRTFLAPRTRHGSTWLVSVCVFNAKRNLFGLGHEP